MSLLNNFAVILNYCFSRQGRQHAERMEKLYGKRAVDWDACHVHSLPGRQELIERLPTPEGGVWIDIGGGTGSNLEFLGHRLAKLSKVYLLDLSPSMLDIARQRVERRGWKNVEILQTDALSFWPATGPVDVVTFSYSLAVIQPWFAALDQAWKLLRPGGFVGVVEYHVSPKHAPPNRRQHSWLTRHLSVLMHQWWEVFPNPDHIPYLHSRFALEHFSEASLGTLIPGLCFPYFMFIGKKPLESNGDRFA